MKKFIVETYYTCTFRTIHTLNELNDKELSKIDNRNDGEVEVIDVKLNNRKTKKIGDKTPSGAEKIQSLTKEIPEEISLNESSKIQKNELTKKLKIYQKRDLKCLTEEKVISRRHLLVNTKCIYILENTMTEK